jgi:hypothetical protein
MTKNEIELFKRRIVIALQWYDEEQSEPAVYVQRDGRGRFEAISWEEHDDEARECSHGVFDTLAEASAVLGRWLWHTQITPLAPERHMDLLVGMLNEECPQGWTMERYIRELANANDMLWSALWRVDNDGVVRRRW